MAGHRSADAEPGAACPSHASSPEAAPLFAFFFLVYFEFSLCFPLTRHFF